VTRLLVLGAGGQVGRDLCRLAGADAVGRGHAELDIADAAAVAACLDETEPQVVVNAAAYTRVDQAESEPEAAYRANAEGPAVLAELCDARRLPLVHISTDYVFDGSKAEAYDEDDPTAPLGVYGASKLAGELAVRQAPRHVILRTAWVYGIHGSNFLKTMLRLAAERDRLRVVADQVGCPTGSADIAGAIVRIAPRLLAADAPFGLYHFAGEGSTSWHGFATAIVVAQARHTGRQPPVDAIATADYPTPARRPANSRLSSARFVATFGFSAWPWQQRMEEVVATLLRPDAAS
jgi:dTDP-4-dehydrorhamnose reductase